jgi:hypothetical protein
MQVELTESEENVYEEKANFLLTSCRHFLETLLVTLCLLIQLAATLQIRTLPNIWPRSLNSSFGEHPSPIIESNLANTLHFNSRNNDNLWRNKQMHSQQRPLTIRSNQHYDGMAFNHNFANCSLWG